MHKDWNELEFTNWNDFRRMAPAIIQLEISRLGKIISSLKATNNTHNLLVKARFDLTQFQNHIKESDEGKIIESQMEKLYSALMCVSRAYEDSDENLKSKITYINDRLTDLINKSQMLY